MTQKGQKPLTERQEKFLEEFAKTGFDLAQRRECAVRAGYPYAMAPANAAKAINKLSQNEKLQKAFKKAGLDFKFIAKKLKENADNENVFASNRALETAIRVLDGNPSQKVDVSKHNVTEINITLTKLEKIEEITGEKILDAEVISD